MSTVDAEQSTCILDKYPLEYFDKPNIPASSTHNPEQWRKKIKLKFFAHKRKVHMDKVYEIAHKIYNSRNMKREIPNNKLAKWKKDFDYKHKNWEKFVDVMTIIQRNDPYFDYNFDPI